MKNLRIVMVEDDVDLCAGWKAVFDLIGHDLVSFNNAQSLLDSQQVLAECDLIISDFYLPDFNGVELIKKVRHTRKDLPAILLTGSRDMGVQVASSAVDNCFVLYKPINIEDLEKKITEIFG